MAADLDPAALHFLPLGGTGEIGMNLNLYHHAGRWLMVDCGVMFGREGTREMHVILPDASYAVARREQLDGLVLTHAHQDHIGAVADLWPELRCRVYATRFCAAMLRSALAEVGLANKVPIQVIEESARIRVGPFELLRIPLPHSTVEMGALLIRTSAGTVLHTGDWKLDPDPVVGRALDQGRLEGLGQHGVDAIVSDSTNADQPGWTPSEGSLLEPLTALFADQPGRIAVTLFASNVARIRTLVEAGARVGRHAVMLGRSLERTVGAARSAGYLVDLPEWVPLREFGYLPPERVLLLCTGSQGEPRAGLARIAGDERRDAYLDEGDTVVFSARTIPGNEPWLARVEAQLAERGVRVVRSEAAPIHVSGHPRQEELRTLLRWVQPRIVVPVHGTPPKLEAHARLAESEGMVAARVRNGAVLRIAPRGPEVVDHVRTGRVLRVRDADRPTKGRR